MMNGYRIYLFLVDIIKKLNQLNISLQGNDNSIIDSFNNINAFQKKIFVFEFQLKNNKVQHFPLLNELEISKFIYIYINNIKYVKEIRKLTAVFESRFTNLDKYKKIFEIYSSPFHTNVKSASDLQMELIDLQYNNELNRIFETSKSKIDFYNINITKEFGTKSCMCF
jgi:hypothetical protein